MRPWGLVLLFLLPFLPAPRAAAPKKRARHLPERGTAEEKLVGVAAACGVYIHVVVVVGMPAVPLLGNRFRNGGDGGVRVDGEGGASVPRLSIKPSAKNLIFLLWCTGKDEKRREFGTRKCVLTLPLSE